MSSSVLKWPAKTRVQEALNRWVQNVARGHPEVERVGYFGSFARGDWGVGSDVDLIIIVSVCPEPFERRGAKWKLTELPVPADVATYTRQEWNALLSQDSLYRSRLQETVWLYDRTQKA